MWEGELVCTCFVLARTEVLRTPSGGTGEELFAVLGPAVPPELEQIRLAQDRDSKDAIAERQVPGAV